MNTRAIKLPFAATADGLFLSETSTRPVFIKIPPLIGINIALA
jgi:hypothetical protein